LHRRDERPPSRGGESLRPDVVLLDILLPDIDGFEVTRRLARECSGAVVALVSTRDAADFGGQLAASGA
jgi:CheY-like chemotaxis protein